MDDILREFSEERQIRRQLANYCRAMDRCDGDLGRAVFHPDATVDYGEMFTGSGHDFVDFSTRAHQAFDSHLHRITNVILEIDGDRAGSETYVDAQFRLTQDGAMFDLYTRGRYIDVWEKRNGKWAIVCRKYINAMSGKRLIEEAPFGISGERNRSDPSYEVLENAPQILRI